MPSEFHGLRALVVDDYEHVRKRLTEALRNLEVQVTEADNGLEAIAKLREETFDILFTDIVMPEMDGFELCEEVRNTPQLISLPVVVVSTHCDSNYIIKALRLGADDYVPKPVDPDLLRKVLARAMTPTLPEASNG